MAKKFLTSPEGQQMIKEFISSPEGMEMVKGMIASPEGKKAAAGLLLSVVDQLPVQDDAKAIIKQALQAI
ncbi:MAG TPA: hypothetical protein VN372_03925 [Methanospirillum sp.]|nr:hypothetical protein [Methanospirillum sp.]